MGGASVIVGASGCIDEIRTSDPDPNGGEETDDRDDDDGPPEEREFPDHPGTLDPDAVEQFVTEYEEVYHHNRHRDVDRYDGADCRTAIAYETEDVVYAISACRFNSTDPGADHIDYEDAGTVLYTVTPDNARRVASIPRHRVDPYWGTDEMPQTEYGYGIWIGSFDESHEISVELHHQTDDGQVEVLDETLRNSYGKHFRGVTHAEGTYELHVELADGTTLTETVEAPNDNPTPATGVLGILAAAVITVEGDLVQWDIEFPDIY